MKQKLLIRAVALLILIAGLLLFVSCAAYADNDRPPGVMITDLGPISRGYTVHAYRIVDENTGVACYFIVEAIACQKR